MYVGISAPTKYVHITLHTYIVCTLCNKYYTAVHTTLQHMTTTYESVNYKLQAYVWRQMYAIRIPGGTLYIQSLVHNNDTLLN